MNREDKIVYTVEEMAHLLNIGRNSAYELAVSKDFPSKRIGKKIIRIEREALYAWMRNTSK